ncbi:HSF-type DNA-binding [Seminavis robusta]|uniref:HSF-type DNA-binding n=1 Tax=Seminavis robusta TaxID=568900 RepID=A0A9N8H509_9STRA|nr:HSF-type DNA-binding [Seminavis robusta]|eukprot:Sro100_g051210.1 HSF-type DNA-binding (433) ;mRNA; f:42732-44141
MQRTNRKTGESQSQGEQASRSEGAASPGQHAAAAAFAATATRGEEELMNESTKKAWDTPPLNFPARLMQVLQLDEPPEGIYWLPDGKRFAVNTEKIEGVLVAYFQGAKWLSFTRTLNKWGFRKALGVDLPAKVVAYYNPHFQKSSPELVTQIINHSRPSNRKRKANREEEQAKNIIPLISGASKERGTPRTRTEPPVDAAVSLTAQGPTATAIASLAAADTTGAAPAAALGLGANARANLLSSVPPFAAARTDEALLVSRRSLLEQMMNPTMGSSSGLQGQFGDLSLPLRLAQRQQQQTQANLRSEFLAQQQLAATADLGNRSTPTVVEQRLRLLQSQLSSQQQLQHQQLQQRVHRPQMLGQLHHQQQRQLQHQGAPMHVDALTISRLEQLRQQHRLARSYEDLLRARGSHEGPPPGRGEGKHDDSQSKSND